MVVVASWKQQGDGEDWKVAFIVCYPTVMRTDGRCSLASLTNSLGGFDWMLGLGGFD